MPHMRVAGMALWPFILLRPARPTARLINHERIHLRQQLELLVIPFYVWYVAEYGWYRWKGLPHGAAYRRISFEREAYAHESDLHFLKKRPLWHFRRYL